ncbi:MAG: ABC transporter permease [Candidatus Nanopelagicales bacterium]|nr:ABC transporter permease [Candidatus Nanopelagicales bacterium]MCF8536877.1 ABC transporter permease [Candidatus Nanopelagicales bacterium]MCF8542355.1 ABC transporter permease [Candidatus Nanopelagicales bacterium]MCF8557646.1 ABC transporter permease [Candidatus Nanopelagicales bacterium]
MGRARARAGQGSAWAAAPGLLYLIGLVLAPLVIIVVYSFLSRAKLGVGVKWEFSAQAYADLLFSESLAGGRSFDPTYLQIIFNSFLFALITSAVTLALALPIAVWIATRPPKDRTGLIFLVTIPFWTSLLIRTYAFIIILNDNGPINAFLGALGLVESPIPMLYTPFATVVGLVYTFLPFMILPIYASAERFDFRLAEAAYDLGGGKWTVLRRIVLPSVRPGVIAGMLLVFIPALGSYLAPELLGGGKTSMIANVIAAQFGASRNWPFGAALSVLLLIITLLVLVAFAVLSKRSARVTGRSSWESML